MIHTSTCDQRFRLGDWVFEPAVDRLWRGSMSHRLEPRLTGVLSHLASNPGRVCSRDEILDAVWKEAVVGEEVLTRAVSELRRLLGDDPQDAHYLETIRSRGYRLLVRPVPIDDGPEPPTDFGAAGTVPQLGRRKRYRGMVILGIVGGILILTGGSVFQRGVHTPDRRSPTDTRLSATPLTSYAGEETYPALSPNGDYIAFGWQGPKGENTDVYVKRVGTESLLRLTDHPGVDTYPRWSHDGSSLAYFHADDRGHFVYTVPMIGGQPRQLLASEGFLGGHAWAPDARHLVYSMTPSRVEPARLYVRDVVSGTDRQLTEPPAGGRGDVFPSVSPDGSQVAFVRVNEPRLDELFTTPWLGGLERQLTQGALLIEGFDWMPDGKAIVYAGVSSASYQLFSIDVGTSEVAAVPTRAEWVWFPTIAEASGRLAYQDIRFNKNIWRVQRTAADPGAEQKPLISSTRWDCEAHYSPDGSRIAFVSARSGHLELWVATAEGRQPLQLTRFSGVSLGRPQWSPDGTRIAFHARPEGNADLFVVTADGGKPRRLTSGGADHLLSSWSRDGTWLYYGTKIEGRWEVLRIHPDEPDLPTQRMTWDGGIAAAETADGNTLLVTKPDRPGLWRIDLDRDTAHPEASLLLPELPGLVDWRNWGVADHGVVMVQYDDNGPSLAWLDLETFELETVCRIPGIARPSLSVSRDGSSILYARVDLRDSDLMLVESIP